MATPVTIQPGKDNTLPQGTFSVPMALLTASDTRIFGVRDKTIIVPTSVDAEGYLFRVYAHGFVCHDVIFDMSGAGGHSPFKFEIPGGAMNERIDIDNCQFINSMHGANWATGLKNSKINNSVFRGTQSYAVYGYNYDTLQMLNNEFYDCGAAFHIDALAAGLNSRFAENYMKGTRGMGMEFQTAPSGVVFEDNWYEHPTLSSTFVQNNSSFAFSLIADQGKNIAIHRNVCIAPERPDGVGCRIGFEVGGDNTLVDDNYINGVNCTVGVTDGRGGFNVTVRNNKFTNFLQGITQSFAGTLTQSNNGPGVKLSAEMERRIAASDRPQRNRPYGTTPTPIPAPTPTPVPTPTDNTVFDFAIVPGDAQGEAKITGLKNMPSGVDSLTLRFKSTQGNETGKKVDAFCDVDFTRSVKWSDVKTPFVIRGLRYGWQLDAKISVEDKNNHTLSESGWKSIGTIPGNLLSDADWNAQVVNVPPPVTPPGPVTTKPINANITIAPDGSITGKVTP